MARPEKKEKEEKGAMLSNPGQYKDQDSIMALLNERLGGTIASKASDVENVDISNAVIHSTGILSLDNYLGCGGFVGGRIVNAYGWEGVGKTLMALTIGAAVQKRGGRCAFCDAEGSFSPSMARAVGVDVDKLILIQSTPEKVMAGEDYFDVMKLLVQMGVEFIIVDSIPTLVPSAKMTARLGEGQKMAQALLLSEGFSSITPLLSAFKKSVIYCINQMRAKPAMNSFLAKYDKQEQYTGGNALPFYMSYSMELKKLEDVIDKVQVASGQFESVRLGVRVRITLDKNKTASIPVDPIELLIYFRTACSEKGVQYTTGVDVFQDAVACAIKTGVITRNGSWLNWLDLKAQGEDAFTAVLKEACQAEPDMFYALRNSVLKLE